LKLGVPLFELVNLARELGCHVEQADVLVLAAEKRQVGGPDVVLVFPRGNPTAEKGVPEILVQKRLRSLTVVSGQLGEKPSRRGENGVADHSTSIFDWELEDTASEATEILWGVLHLRPGLQVMVKLDANAVLPANAVFGQLVVEPGGNAITTTGNKGISGRDDKNPEPSTAIPKLQLHVLTHALDRLFEIGRGRVVDEKEPGVRVQQVQRAVKSTRG
jgi:hypothetical protein